MSVEVKRTFSVPLTLPLCFSADIAKSIEMLYKAVKVIWAYRKRQRAKASEESDASSVLDSSASSTSSAIPPSISFGFDLAFRT